VSIQTQVLSALRERINALGAFAPVTPGALPAENGLSMAVSTGRAVSVTLAHGGVTTLDVAINCKHTDQATALDTLCLIFEALAKAQSLPCGDDWQTTAVRIGAAPGYLDRDGPFWLYGGALSVEYVTD